ncbi:hypothetical protein WN943_019155 [Citrus x changshan-huyou]
MGKSSCGSPYYRETYKKVGWLFAPTELRHQIDFPRWKRGKYQSNLLMANSNLASCTFVHGRIPIYSVDERSKNESINLLKMSLIDLRSSLKELLLK